MPGYGIHEGETGLLPWSWARERLERTPSYWVATMSAQAGPHLAAVWGVWAEQALWFSTGGRSRKARDLAGDPRCSVSVESADESVVIEGLARPAKGDVDALRETYTRKYGMGFPDTAGNPLFRVAPRVVIGIRVADFASSATRWTFI